jgi:hypothetical protein
MKLQAIRIIAVTLMLVVAYVAGQHSAIGVAAQSRQKWEYRIVRSLHSADEINKLGEEGWEAVTLNASNRVLLRRSK